MVLLPLAAPKAFSGTEIELLNLEADRWTREYRAQPELEFVFWPPPPAPAFISLGR